MIVSSFFPSVFAATFFATFLSVLRVMVMMWFVSLFVLVSLMFFVLVSFFRLSLLFLMMFLVSGFMVASLFMFSFLLFVMFMVVSVFLMFSLKIIQENYTAGSKSHSTWYYVAIGFFGEIFLSHFSTDFSLRCLNRKFTICSNLDLKFWTFDSFTFFNLIFFNFLISISNAFKVKSRFRFYNLLGPFLN